MDASEDHVRARCYHLLRQREARSAPRCCRDDVSGTFAFVRALEEHLMGDLSSCAIGKTWLNNVVEKQSVFW
jgi:hypothetical protein